MFSRNRNFLLYFRRNLTKIKIPYIPNPYPELNLTICGAFSKIGKLSTMLFKRESIFKKLVLWDEDYDVMEMVKDDLCAIKTNTNFRVFCGRKGLQDAVSDSRIIYICDNIQTNPGLSPIDLFKCNANKVRQIILYISEFNPTAMVVIGTPCITSLVPMAYEEMLKNDCDASKQIFGLARGYLNIVGATARALNPNAKYTTVHGVVGGCDRNTSIPVFAHSESDRVLSVPDFTPKTKEENPVKGAKSAFKYFKTAEEQVLKSKIFESNSDGCYMFQAFSGFQFIMNLAKALSGHEKISDYAFIRQKNPKNYYERYFTCKVNLSTEGLESSSVPELTPEETKQLKSIDSLLNSYIHVGEIYITGREQIPKHRKKIEKVKKEVEPKKEKIEVKEDVFCKARPKPKSLLIKSE